MEDIISENNVVEDEIYLIFKDSVVCPICSKILINPLMCMKCQKVYCKKCIEEWSKRNDKCPNRCEDPNYQNSIEKNNLLSKLKFKCGKCGEEIFYDNVKNHTETCESNNDFVIINNKDKNACTKSKRMRRLTRDELYKMNRKKIAHITRKIN